MNCAISVNRQDLFALKNNNFFMGNFHYDLMVTAPLEFNFTVNST